MKIQSKIRNTSILGILCLLGLSGCQIWRWDRGSVPGDAPSMGEADVESYRDAVRPKYEPEGRISGRLRSIGSDTMDVLMAEWEKVFKGYHPSIIVIHEGRGTSTAIPGLIEGRSEFGPMSREVRDTELEKFQSRFGYAPTLVPTAIDALAVYVHPSNPVLQRGLTLAEIDAIFSSTRSRGAREDIVTWGQLGLTGEWANAPITVYSRNKASGTYGFFKENALNFGEFKKTNIELPGSADVVEAITNDRFGIGYSGFGYKTDGVATVAIATATGGEPIEANEKNAVSGVYPLSRFLFIATNIEPGRAVSDLQREFFRFVFSDEGQQIVAENGYFPVRPGTAARELEEMGL